MIVGGNKTNSAVSGTGKGSHPIADHWLPIFNKNYPCKWWICQVSSSCHFARISVSHLGYVLDIPHSHDAPFRRFSFLRSVGYESRNRSKLPPFRFRSQLHLDSSCHKNSHTTVQCGWLEKKRRPERAFGPEHFTINEILGQFPTMQVKSRQEDIQKGQKNWNSSNWNDFEGCFRWVLHWVEVRLVLRFWFEVGRP